MGRPQAWPPVANLQVQPGDDYPNPVRNTEAQIRIGASGWRHKPWRGCFYPKDLTSSHYLSRYWRHFNTIEINQLFLSSSD